MTLVGLVSQIASTQTFLPYHASLCTSYLASGVHSTSGASRTVLHLAAITARRVLKKTRNIFTLLIRLLSLHTLLLECL